MLLCVTASRITSRSALECSVPNIDKKNPADLVLGVNLFRAAPEGNAETLEPVGSLGGLGGRRKHGQKPMFSGVLDPNVCRRKIHVGILFSID